MQDYQQRVVNEKGELDEKLGKLELFIEHSETYQELDPAEQSRLKRQRNIMINYSSVLAERIGAFI